MKKRLIILFSSVFLLANLILPVQAAITVPEETDYYVNDYMNVLSESTVDTINTKNDQLDGGAEILILTTDYIDTDSEEYAYRIFNQWKIGDAENNNGVLILLVIQEEKFWIATGTGLDDVLDAGTLSDIIYDYMEADFDAGRYDEAVLNTFNAIWQIVSAKYGVVEEAPVSSDTAYQPSNPASVKGGFLASMGNFFSTIFVIALIILILVLVICLPRRRRYGAGPIFFRPRRPAPPRPQRPAPRPAPRPAAPRPAPRSSNVRTPSRPSSSRSGGISGGMGRSVSSGMRSSGGGRSRGGGAGRK